MKAIISLLLLLSLPVPARAEGEAGKFDYYVLALSWSPAWCTLTGRARNSPQCDDDRQLGWVLHGLWPQYEQGWPDYCRSTHAPPTRSQAAAMSDIMGDDGAARHQWNRHGTCSGLAPEEYFTLARRAYDQVNRPALLRQLTKDVTLPARVVEDAFLEANPALQPDMVTITCNSGRIREARICLTRELTPRVCGSDVVRDCTMQDALFEAID